ncbi:MAG: hypothetical protein HY826_15250 [Actinobacteria bacterium]|nr:hypothetical protein [Actinomycetota bacterium]
MTELQAPQRAERPSAARPLPVRSAPRSTQRGKPGHASKIFTAGLSTSLVLGIVSYLGNAAKAEARQQAQAELEAAQALQPTIAPVIDTATTVVPAVTPVDAAPAGAAPSVTAAATPAAPAAPTAPVVPQVIAIAVPVPPPPAAAAPPPAATPSSGTTKASG